MKTQVIAAIALAAGTAMAAQPDAETFEARRTNNYAAHNGGTGAGMEAPGPVNGRGRRASGIEAGSVGGEGVPVGPARSGPRGRRGFEGPRPEAAFEGEALRHPQHNGPEGRRAPNGPQHARRGGLPPQNGWTADETAPAFDGQARPPRRQPRRPGNRANGPQDVNQ